MRLPDLAGGVQHTLLNVPVGLQDSCLPQGFQACTLNPKT